MATPDNQTPAPKTPPATAAPTTATPTVSVDLLAAAFAQAMGISNSQLAEALSALKPKEKITLANRVTRNPMNPTNRARKFPVKYYQNFTEVYEDDVLDEEYDLLLKLKPGSFITGTNGEPLVEVIEVKRGAQRGMHIRYNNKTTDQRMEFMVKCGGSMAEMLTKCIKEYERHRVESKAARRRELEED
jgi:hypothetical protein